MLNAEFLTTSIHRATIARGVIALLIISAFRLLSLSAFAQGSLTPPAGPATTFKTLQQIEPRIDLQKAPASAVTTSNASYHFIITQPGSYYLSAAIGATKTNAIQINAAGVTLDLNGFEISRSSGTGGSGIEISPTSHHASVFNGHINGFDSGIRSVALSGYAAGCAFEDIIVTGCTAYGIFAGGTASIRSCIAFNNPSGAVGIHADNGSSVTDCVATNNGSVDGIYAGAGSAMLNCVGSSNHGSGHGLFASSGSSIINCSARTNTAAGIGSGPEANLINCAAFSNGTGFDVGVASSIQSCIAAQNSGDGINVANDSVVRDNFCYGNNAGIHATSSDNRIEGNNVVSNHIGIDIDGTGSLIIKNSAADNNLNNYDIVADNRYGPVIDITAASPATVSGSSAAETLTTTHPWANFSY